MSANEPLSSASLRTVVCRVGSGVCNGFRNKTPVCEEHVPILPSASRPHRAALFTMQRCSQETRRHAHVRCVQAKKPSQRQTSKQAKQTATTIVCHLVHGGACLLKGELRAGRRHRKHAFMRPVPAASEPELRTLYVYISLGVPFIVRA